MLDTSIHRKSHYQGDKYSTKTNCIHWVELYPANSVKHLQTNGPWLCALMYSLHLYFTETSVFKWRFLSFVYIYQLNTLCGMTCFYGQPANTDSCWIPGETWHLTQQWKTPAIEDLRIPPSVPTAQFYCSNSRYWTSISIFRHFQHYLRL